ncbi:hypothetical protein RYX36_009638 [Vicia faba]
MKKNKNKNLSILLGERHQQFISNLLISSLAPSLLQTKLLCTSSPYLFQILMSITYAINKKKWKTTIQNQTKKMDLSKKMKNSTVEQLPVSFAMHNHDQFHFWEVRGGFQSGSQGINGRSCWLRGFSKVVKDGKGRRAFSATNRGDVDEMWLLLLSGGREILAFGGLPSDE